MRNLALLILAALGVFMLMGKNSPQEAIDDLQNGLKKGANLFDPSADNTPTFTPPTQSPTPPTPPPTADSTTDMPVVVTPPMEAVVSLGSAYIAPEFRNL